MFRKVSYECVLSFNSKEDTRRIAFQNITADPCKCTGMALALAKTISMPGQRTASEGLILAPQGHFPEKTPLSMQQSQYTLPHSEQCHKTQSLLEWLQLAHWLIELSFQWER